MKVDHHAINIESMAARTKLKDEDRSKLVENYDQAVLTSINAKLAALGSLKKQPKKS